MFGGADTIAPRGIVDPVVMAAATVLRLQPLPPARSRARPRLLNVASFAPHEGEHHPGQRGMLLISAHLRSVGPQSRPGLHHRISRVRPRLGAPKPPTVELTTTSRRWSMIPPPRRGSGGVRWLVAPIGRRPRRGHRSETSGCWPPPLAHPSVLAAGRRDPSGFAGASSAEEILRLVGSVPANHSPHYAPVPQTDAGDWCRRSVTASREWLPAPAQSSAVD